MDWKMFEAPKSFLCFPASCPVRLRKNRLIKYTWLYYLMIIFDLIARFFFTYTLIPSGKSLFPTTFGTLNYLTPTLKLVRRSLWLIFKLEAKEAAARVKDAKTVSQEDSTPLGEAAAAKKTNLDTKWSLRRACGLLWDQKELLMFFVAMLAGALTVVLTRTPADFEVLHLSLLIFFSCSVARVHLFGVATQCLQLSLLTRATHPCVPLFALDLTVTVLQKLMDVRVTNGTASR